MQKKNLKHTDMGLSCICLGTDDFGTAVEKKRAFEVMDLYYEMGGNVIDTARVYAAWFPGGEGMSEKTVGEWLKERRIRDSIILSSKCAHPPIGRMDISRLSAREIEEDIDQSLLALGVDFIDIMWLHRDDIKIPVSEIMDSLNSIYKKGKVGHFGVSNWHAHRIEEANAYAINKSMMQLTASQIKWSYAKTNPQYKDDSTLVEMNDVELLFYQKSGMPIFAYAPQAKGFFSKYEKGGLSALSEKAAERYYFDENAKRYTRAKRLADELKLPISSVILGYITARKDIDAYAIIGCKNAEQLKDSIGHLDFKFTDEMLHFLDIKGENNSV